MKLSERLLSLSRPLTSVVILVLYMAGTDIGSRRMALYAVSAAFYIASSAILVRWIASPTAAGGVVIRWDLADYQYDPADFHLPSRP